MLREIFPQLHDWLQSLLVGLGLPLAVAAFLVAVVGVLIVANFALANAAVITLIERRLMGFFQSRLGPNRVGPQGALQPIADAIKLITKEVVIPRSADKLVFVLAPLVVAAPFILAYAVLPFGPGGTVVDLNIGVVFVLAAFSPTFLGIFMAGWASNNKYALLGAMRAVAQAIGFEVPMGLALLGVVMLAGSLSLAKIVEAQRGIWYVIPELVGAVIFLVAGMAEVSRHPFDLSEAESELVSGYNTEYSSMLFGLFFMAEFGASFTIAALFAILFLGGWQGPLLPPVVWFLGKAYAVYFLMAWIRFSVPRFRIDQFMTFGWKVLVPLSFCNLFWSALLVNVWSV